MRWLTGFREKYKRSIQVRLMCYFILTLIPFIAFSLFANFRSRLILEQELGERTMSAMSSALEYVDLTLGSFRDLSTMISTDVNLTSRLNETEDVLAPSAVIDFARILDQLTNITAVNQSLTDTMIFHSKSGLMISGRKGAVHRDNFREEAWFQEAVKANGGIVLYLPDRDLQDLSGSPDPIYDQSQILLVRLMDLYNRNQSPSPNVLLMSLRKDKLLLYLDHLIPSRSSRMYLLDNTGRLVASNAGADQPVPRWDDPDENHVVREAPDSSGKMLMLRVVSPRSGWSLLMMQPEEEIYKKSKPLQIFTYCIIAISFLVALWISWVIYSGIAAPVSALVHGMKQLRIGKLDVQLENKREDELGYLTQAFNQTVEQQRHLIKDIYEQQLRLTKTELKFLQAQINPHFLYNTLDSIYWSAKQYDADDIGEMVLNLSRFFRLSLSKGQEAFTVEETATHLQYYIRVQQIRFNGQFTVEYKIAEECRNLYVLKLILQPLVENAILHGLEKKTARGELVISAEMRGDRLILRVSDNGKGVAAPRLLQLRNALDRVSGNDSYSSAERSGQFFGLLNVKARIKIYYGDSAELYFDSREGEGTTVSVDLPVQRCRSQWEGENS
ncbi:sensor histidine kinase [Paenibacillus sp. YN15]|uniref:sensor histidine kinase n=1 Tax=Paenibacillus sp. YN15 TaxID=1742774 RepID=UPI000DCBE50E|nr:sensor histidine kinase [Paenibacillus sp. YN15]RAV04609.1 two-component sensor histidine kinase [Paenibacillus sp. YN15]